MERGMCPFYGQKKKKSHLAHKMQNQRVTCGRNKYYLSYYLAQ
jgi:hypothetical protein